MFNLREHLTYDQANITLESTDKPDGGKDLYIRSMGSEYKLGTLD